MKWLQQWCGWSWGEAGATCANGVVIPAGFIWPSRRRSAHPQKVSVSVVKQPVVNHHIPRAVIVGERRRVPPVLQRQSANLWYGAALRHDVFVVKEEANLSETVLKGLTDLTVLNTEAN